MYRKSWVATQGNERNIKEFILANARKTKKVSRHVDKFSCFYMVSTCFRNCWELKKKSGRLGNYNQCLEMSNKYETVGNLEIC